MSDPNSSKPQLPPVDTQVASQALPPPQQQQQQPPQQQQQQQQPPQHQQPLQQQTQQPQQQQPQLQLQQPPQQQQGVPYQQQQYGSGPPSPSNLAPQVSYQQQPYGSGPPSPNLAAPQAPYPQHQYGSAPPSPSNLAPPTGGSPQPGYAQPAGYPPAPQQAGYPPTMQHPGPPSPQGYYHGYPPAAQQGYQYPPQQQQFPTSPQAGYPGYPPQHAGYPPQQYPPQQPAYGYPPPPHSPHYDPNWQQPAYLTPTITYPVSAGYTTDECAPPHYNPQPDADVISKALMPSSGLNNRDGEEALIHILPFLAPQQLESIRQYILTRNGVRVLDLVDKALSNDFQDVVRAVVLGPLAFDAWLLKRAMGGVGYKSVYMNMVLLGRRNGDVKAIEAAYYRAHGRHLVEAIKSELSGPIEALFRNAVEARRQDENAPVLEAAVEKDVVELYTAMVGSVEAHVVAEILVTRSDAQIRRITELYNSKYGVGKEKKLEDVIVKKFKGHMEDALLYIVQGANNKAMRDAKMLERTMKGVGTKTEELTYRIAILHWDKAHLEAVKAAYRAEFPKRTDLITRVKGDTSGNHGKMLLALIA
ncbi:hypothetical protein DFP73DRAFT_600056 [Morchella snyderi]|nr:hypothetical protein DFP73DRAFT_600056 [Morchella snyderi]